MVLGSSKIHFWPKYGSSIKIYSKSYIKNQNNLCCKTMFLFWWLQGVLKVIGQKNGSLTYFRPMFPFYISLLSSPNVPSFIFPYIRKQTDFLVFSGDIKWEQLILAVPEVNQFIHALKVNQFLINILILYSVRWGGIRGFWDAIKLQHWPKMS